MPTAGEFRAFGKAGQSPLQSPPGTRKSHTIFIGKGTQTEPPLGRGGAALGRRKPKDITKSTKSTYDRWHCLYIILFIHGIVILLPFNVFITAKYYFEEHKLQKTTYADNCLAFVGIVMQLPNLIISWLNVFRGIGGERIASRCLFLEILFFLFTVFLAMLDTTQCTCAFYVLTMMSVFVISVCNAFFLYYVLAISTNLPPLYSGAVDMGSSLCGTLVVIANMLADQTRSHRNSTVYYFIVVLVVLHVCLDLFLALPLNGFYQNYIEPSVQRVKANYRKNGEENGEALPKSSVLTIFKEGWVHNYTLWFICFVSFSVFPAVHSDIHSMNGFDGNDFTKITCFLTYNVTSFIGSITAYMWNFPRAPWLWTFALVRALFCPFFLFCNYLPRQQGELMERTLPVLIRNDAVYWCAAMLLGWSMGHGCTLAMMYVGGEEPSATPEEEPQKRSRPVIGVAQLNASMEGKIGAAMVATGIFCGLCFSLLAPTVVTTSLWRFVHGGVFIGPYTSS